MPLLGEHLSEPVRLAEAFGVGVHEGDEGDWFHETMIPAALGSTSGVGLDQRRHADDALASARATKRLTVTAVSWSKGLAFDAQKICLA